MPWLPLVSQRQENAPSPVPTDPQITQITQMGHPLRWGEGGERREPGEGYLPKFSEPVATASVLCCGLLAVFNSRTHYQSGLDAERAAQSFVRETLRIVSL
jgi:hypothetical protein